MTEEVGQALIDYLQHGRPVTPYQEVFLRLHAPVAAEHPDVSPYLITYRRRAGITFGGAPAWPAFLAPFYGHASARSGHPLEVISAVLGHRSLESTQVYLKVDLESTQCCLGD